MATSLRSERSQGILDGLALAVAAALTIWFLILGTGIDAWRHDSLYYLVDYRAKATTEGRWLIWIFFRVMTALPGGLLWLLGNLLFGGFVYRAARTSGQDAPSSALFALLALQIPAAVGQGLWPAGTLLGPLLLFMATFLHERMPLVGFYALFGMLFSGVSQQYYFFLPILHVPRTLASSEGPLRAAIRLLALWVLGFLLGYAGILAFLRAATGSADLAIPEWREPNYVTGPGSLAENLASRARFLADHLGVLVRLAPAGLAIALLAALDVARRRREETWVRLCVFGAVGLAIYAVTVPVGVVVQFRTTTPLFFAILAFAFLGRSDGLHRLLRPIAILVVFLSFWNVNVGNLRWYRAVTEFYRDELVRVAPLPPSVYEGVLVVGGTARPLQRWAERASGTRPRFIVPHLSVDAGPDMRWRPAAIAAGFRSVAFCTEEPCRSQLPDFDAGCATESPAYCVHGTSPSGHLLISFREP